MRELVAGRMANYKRAIAQYYNSKVKKLHFKPEDLVFKKNLVGQAESLEKLSLIWEGSYRVIEANQNGFCKLAYRDGVLVPWT